MLTVGKCQTKCVVGQTGKLSRKRKFINVTGCCFEDKILPLNRNSGSLQRERKLIILKGLYKNDMIF
ncbi:hypothetical protein AVM02_00090 [Brucella anthropi]